MSKPFIREVYALYIYQGDYHFYGWNHWSEFGTLTCFYTNEIESVIKSPKIKKYKLYRARAVVDRNPDDPEDIYDSAMSLAEVDDPKAAIKFTTDELERFEEADKDIIADNLKLLLSKF